MREIKATVAKKLLFVISSDPSCDKLRFRAPQPRVRKSGSATIGHGVRAVQLMREGMVYVAAPTNNGTYLYYHAAHGYEPLFIETPNPRLSNYSRSSVQCPVR